MSLSRAVTAIASVSAAILAWASFTESLIESTFKAPDAVPFFHGDLLATPQIPSVCTLQR